MLELFSILPFGAWPAVAAGAAFLFMIWWARRSGYKAARRKQEEQNRKTERTRNEIDEDVRVSDLASKIKEMNKWSDPH